MLNILSLYEKILLKKIRLKFIHKKKLKSRPIKT